MSVTTAPHARVDDPAPTATTVDVIVVTSSQHLDLHPLLDTLALQDQRPDRVTVIDRTGGSSVTDALADHDLGRGVALRVHTADPDTSVRAALTELQRDEPADERLDLWWVLPPGSVPESDTLDRLLRTLRRSDSAGLVGPKHLETGRPTALLGVGISATRTGRVLDTPPVGESDQGQYDHREDVLALPLAGLLIDRELLATLGGWEPSFGSLGADLDLSWRAHGLGRRVVLEPHARMRSSAETVHTTATTSSLRRQARRVALVRASWWSSPLLALWIALTSVLGALGLLLLKRPRAAAREFADLGALDPIRGLLARSRTRTKRTVSRRHLRSLFASGGDVQRLLMDSVHEALVPVRPVAERAADDLPGRSWVTRTLTHPGALAVLAAAAVSAAASRTLPGAFFSRISTGVSGGELTGTRADSNALWHGFLDGWTGAGLGGPGTAQPHLALLAALTWIAEHTIATNAASSPAGAAIGALFAVALPLATLTAYLAGRVLTPLRWPRALGALAWATTGIAATSVAQGRLGAVVALCVLPLVGAGLVRLSRPEGTATGAFATALGAAALGAFAPFLLVVVLLIAVALLLLGRGATRGRAAILLLTPALLLGPWVGQLAQNPRRLLGGPGLTAWARPEPPDWQLALLHPGGAGSLPVWLTLPVVVLGVLGLALSANWVSPRRVLGGAALSTALGAIGVLALAAALAAPRIVLAEIPVGLPDAGGDITPWPGTPMLLLALVLLASAVRLVAAIPLRRSRARRWILVSWPAVAGLTAAALATSAALGWFAFGHALRTRSDPRPPVAIDQAGSALAGRMVFVTPGSSGASYRTLGREAGPVARDLPDIPAADGDLAPIIAGLLDGTRPQAARTLAASAIGFVAVDRRAPAELERRLDASAGLTRLAPRGTWEVWRVETPIAATSGALAPPRLHLESPSGPVVVPTTGAHGATQVTLDVPPEAKLVVAQPGAWAQAAVVRIDGTQVFATDDPLPTYSLPTGRHELSITVPGPDRWWHLLQGGALLLVLFLAIPFGTHEFRTRR